MTRDQPLGGPARRYGYHDIDPSQLTEAAVIVNDDEAVRAVRAVAGHEGEKAVADASELKTLLDMLGLLDDDGKPQWHKEESRT